MTVLGRPRARLARGAQTPSGRRTRAARKLEDALGCVLPAGRTPLLDCKQRSVWRKLPFGLDQFGRRVQFCLMWISLLIGAQPRIVPCVPPSCCRVIRA